MIVGVGIDMVEIERINSAINNQAFVRRVFTPKEQEYCEQRRAGRASSYAARFAGKEAVLKALGTGLSGGKLVDIEIIVDDRGCPHVILHGYFKNMAEKLGITKLNISLTHTRQYAAAQVVLWGGADK